MSKTTKFNTGMERKNKIMMRTKPRLLIQGREKNMVLPRERHLQSRGGRRTLEGSSVLLVMILVIMLQSVHNGGEG
jgi:hypothetical protein